MSNFRAISKFIFSKLLPLTLLLYLMSPQTFTSLGSLSEIAARISKHSVSNFVIGNCCILLPDKYHYFVQWIFLPLTRFADICIQYLLGFLVENICFSRVNKIKLFKIVPRKLQIISDLKIIILLTYKFTDLLHFVYHVLTHM